MRQAYRLGGTVCAALTLVTPSSCPSCSRVGDRPSRPNRLVSTKPFPVGQAAEES